MQKNNKAIRRVKISERVARRCGVSRSRVRRLQRKPYSRAHQRNVSSRKLGTRQRNKRFFRVRPGARLLFAPHLSVSDPRFSSVDWVGKTVADVRVSHGHAGFCNSLLVIFSDGTEVSFCATEQSVVWATITPQMLRRNVTNTAANAKHRVCRGKK